MTLVFLIVGASCTETEDHSEFTLEEGFARALLAVSSSAETQRVFDDLYVLEEELTAACMTAEGFDYIAERRETTATGIIDGRARETVEKWGFFISTVDFSAIETEDSPNSAVYVGLSIEEQQVWNDTLFACQTRSSDEVAQQYGLDDILDQTDQIYSRIERDAEVLSARDEWVVCMRSEGLKATSEEDLIAMLTAQFARTDPADHARFKSEEIRIALISFDCRQPLDIARANAVAREVQALDPTWGRAIGH